MGEGFTEYLARTSPELLDFLDGAGTALIVAAALLALVLVVRMKRAIGRGRRKARRVKRQVVDFVGGVKTIVLVVTFPVWGPCRLGAWIYQAWQGDHDREPVREKISQGLRQRIMARDGCTCQVIDEVTGKVCGHYMTEDNPVDIHHWLPFKPFPWLDTAIWNLVCACKECNLKLGASIPKYARNWEEGDKIICLATEMQPPRGLNKWLKSASF